MKCLTAKNEAFDEKKIPFNEQKPYSQKNIKFLKKIKK